jgi:hypothetical protein
MGKSRDNRHCRNLTKKVNFRAEYILRLLRKYEGITMIANDQQLEATLGRIAWFQKQVAHLRKTETNPTNYRASVSGFLAEIDRMQLEVREYFSVLPAEMVGAT